MHGGGIWPPPSRPDGRMVRISSAARRHRVQYLQREHEGLETGLRPLRGYRSATGTRHHVTLDQLVRGFNPAGQPSGAERLYDAQPEAVQVRGDSRFRRDHVAKPAREFQRAPWTRKRGPRCHPALHQLHFP